MLTFNLTHVFLQIFLSVNIFQITMNTEVFLITIITLDSRTNRIFKREDRNY